MKSTRGLAPYQEAPRGPMRDAGADANPMRRMPAINPEQTFFHFDFMRALEMHRGLALGIFLTAFLLSAAYLARRWNTYKAESLVYVQPAPPRLLGNVPGEETWPYDANTYESYIQQQIHNVTREDVLAGAVRRIPDYEGTNESEQAAANRLAGAIQVDRVSTGYQIAITATAGSAAEAAQVANAVADSFIQSATKELRSGDAQRIALLGEERDRVMKELASDRAEQDTLNKQLGVAAVGTATPDPYDDQIAAIRSELVKARTDNDEAAAKLMATAGGGLSSAALDAAADEIVAADPGLVSMKTALNKRRSDLISQMANLTPQHPIYKQDAQELAKINSSLDAMTKNLRAKAAAQIEQRLKTDLERTSGVQDRLNAQLAQMTRAAGSATPRLQRANDLATDIARLQTRFSAVDEQYRNLMIDNAAPGAVYLSAPAIAPLHANRKKVYRNAIILLLAGIIFALAAALIAHNLDPRIYIAADVEQVLGFAPMAQLPDLYEVGTGVAEEYMLRLAAAVEHAHQQGHLNSCIFTAVAPGAGATTVSTRVSSMLQAMGRATALVDAVGAPPKEDVQPGSELVHLARGSRSTALLQQMAEDASDETIVVTDTAPLLISGETEYLARFVDSAIVVIESGTTTKAQLREVAQTLERLDVAAVGFVLNRISMAKGNPAFRQSVHAVEKHLKAQTRAYDRQRPRSQPPLEDSAMETPPSPPANQRHWEAVSEPLNGPPQSVVREHEARKGREVVPSRETIVVNEPRGQAAEEPAARATRAGAPPNAPPGWQMENFMFPDEPRHAPPAASVPRENTKAEPRTEEADGFLPWETEFPAPIGARLAETATFASETSAPASGDASIPVAMLDEDEVSPTESAPEDAGALPSYLHTPQEPAPVPAYAEFLKEPLEPVVCATEEPWRGFEATENGLSDYLCKLKEELAAAAAPPQTAVSDDFDTLAVRPQAEHPPQQDQLTQPDLTAFQASDAGGNRPQSWMAAPPKPARGREGVHVVLGGRPSAPLTGEEVPDAWRERLRSEAETVIPDQPLASEEAPPLKIASLLRDQGPSRPADPFGGMQDAQARREPLKEWWEELAASAEQPPAAEAVAAVPAPAAEPAPSLPAAQEVGAPKPVPIPVTEVSAGQVRGVHSAAEIPQQDDALYNAATRLSGLRNLLVSLGIQTLHQGVEQRKAEAQSEPRTVRAPQRAIYAQPVGPEGSGDQPAGSVTARPEIIPPLFNAGAAESEKAAKTPKTPVKSPRVSSWDSPDDVDILPARRGQYRRSH